MRFDLSVIFGLNFESNFHEFSRTPKFCHELRFVQRFMRDARISHIETR